MKRIGIAVLAACAILFCAVIAADPGGAAPASPESAADGARPPESGPQAPAIVEQPLKMNEPMQGGMMKQGMMKKDMKRSAERKEKEMEDRLQQEERSMP